MPVSGNPRTYIAAGTIPAFSLVKMDTDGKVVVNTLAGVPIGWTEQDAVAGDAVAVFHRYTPQTARLIAGEAIATAGVAVYAGANGKVVDTSTSAGNIIGYTNSAASGDGSEIEVTLCGPGAG